MKAVKCRLQVLYSPAAYGVDLSSQNAPKPRARINANMCVVKNTLWLFGGIVEIGDKEVCPSPAVLNFPEDRHAPQKRNVQAEGRQDFSCMFLLISVQGTRGTLSRKRIV
jgi:hypothetical protein